MAARAKIVVYDDILVRLWNPPATAGVECDDQPVPQGLEAARVRHQRPDRPFLFSIEETNGMGGVVGIGGRWHCAGFTRDGDVLALGWESGGGAAGECEADDADINDSLFFYDANTGERVGRSTLPGP